MTRAQQPKPQDRNRLRTRQANVEESSVLSALVALLLDGWHSYWDHLDRDGRNRDGRSGHNMSFTNLHGVIRRRILVNYRVDPAAMGKRLPAGLKPLIVKGKAMAGICLIRLEQIRPRMVPAWLGLASENAAHRVAVTWTTAAGETKEGVYIPRRDTDSRLNYWVGGRLFPGIHHLASFDITDTDHQVAVAMKSEDDAVEVRVAGRPTGEFPNKSVFRDLSEASNFYEGGNVNVGYSDTRDPTKLDGLKLKTDHWKVESMEVDTVMSSYFGNPEHFPEGSVEFDCALLMRNIPHEWERTGDLAVRASAA